MSILTTTSTIEVPGTVVSLEAATDDSGERKTTRRGGQYTLLTFLAADAEEGDDPEVAPVWVPLEAAAKMYPIGEAVNILIEEKVTRRRSVQGVSLA